jgi:hypothetical protein
MFVELYDSNKTLLATNDDGYPRSSTDSSLTTLLPATGTYFVKVQEWCISPTANATYCTPDYAASLANTAYAVGAFLDAPGPGTKVEAEPNDTAATAGTDVEFSPVTGTPGSYYLTLLQGKIPASDTADWYSFTVPNDVTVDATTRVSAGFYLPWGATTGNGSNVIVGNVEVYKADFTTVISAFDFSNEPEAVSGRADLRVPVTLGAKYFVKITKGGTEPNGQGDFYFAYETLGAGNPLENDAMNNAAPGEALTQQANADGSVSYFVEGDITPGDADFFKVDPAAQPTISVACSSQRAGSGLRGFKATVLNGATELTNAIETVDKDLAVQYFDLGGTVPASLTVKIEATAPADATNTGKSYLCGIHFGPAPAP